MKNKLPILTCVVIGAVVAILAGVIQGYRARTPQDVTHSQQRSNDSSPADQQAKESQSLVPKNGSEIGTFQGNKLHKKYGQNPAPLLDPDATTPETPLMGDLITNPEGTPKSGQKALLADAFTAEMSRALASNGQLLITETAKAVFQQPSITAEIRQKIDLFSHRMVGTGKYFQLFGEGGSKERQLRLDLKIQIGDQESSWQSISEGRFLWQRRDLPGETRDISGRVDLQRVREAVKNAGLSSNVTPKADQWLAFGGLAQLLQSLDKNFLFSPPKAHSAGTWVIRGKWRREQLAALISDEAQKQAILAGKPLATLHLPAHLPDSVIVVINQDQLFPLLIDYRRHIGQADKSKSKSIVSMELFNIHFSPPPDPCLFDCNPNNREVEDLTDTFIKKLHLTPNPKK